MSNVADHTLELIERVYADLANVKREQLSQGPRLATIKQHFAANQVEIARINAIVRRSKDRVHSVIRTASWRSISMPRRSSRRRLGTPTGKEYARLELLSLSRCPDRH